MTHKTLENLSLFPLLPMAAANDNIYTLTLLYTAC